MGVAARVFFTFERVASSSLPLGIVKDSVRSTMESSRADVTSLQIMSFQSQLFLYVLRFDHLHAFAPIFSSMSSFLSNDVGCGDF